MSYGLAICSICRHEVHQNGPFDEIRKRRLWLHCEDKTPICDGAVARYPDKFATVLGNPCKRDEVLPGENP